MRILVCEVLTAGAFVGNSAGLDGKESLFREGAAMRDAMLADLASLADVTACVPYDDRMAAPFGEAVPVTSGDDAWAVWADLAGRCDAVWPVAPEMFGMLERLTRELTAQGARCLGSSAEAVRLCSSKRQTARHLAAHGIAAAPTWLRDEMPSGRRGPFVVKPDDGAGCEATWLRSEGLDVFGPDCVFQPYIEGEAASLTVFSGPGGVLVLTANRQHVRLANAAFRFEGVTVGAFPVDAALASLGRHVAEAIPGLNGIFGIDFVFGETGPVVLEVNARLTTSYAGLARSLGINPAALVLGRLTLTETPPARPIEISLVEAA